MNLIEELKEIVTAWKEGVEEHECNDCPVDQKEAHEAKIKAYREAAEQIQEVIRRHEND